MQKSGKCKATFCINYAFKKFAKILNWKISEKELLLHCCMKQIAFFAPIDELKKHSVNVININQISTTRPLV